MNQNVKAFLDMIAWSELGPEILAESSDGYNVLVGSLPGKVKLFHDYSDHPRILVKINDSLSSTAAGRYQILKRTFDFYKKQFHLPDFSRFSQDVIAIQLIKECGALDDITSGNIYSAIHKCRSRWASLPGAGYGQHEQRIEPLISAYRAAGGKLSEEE